MTFAAMENESAVIVMVEYIDKSALYEEISRLEEISRDKYLETPSNSPCYSRYMAQSNKCTAFKHIIADFHSADVAPVRHGRWIASHDEFALLNTQISFLCWVESNKLSPQLWRKDGR